MRRLRALPLVPVAALAVACSSGSSPRTATSAPPSSPTPNASTTASACPSPTFQLGGAGVPGYLPRLPAESVINSFHQGKTRIWDVSTPGKPRGIVRLRDQLVQQLQAKGFTLKGKDQEPGHEAEAEYAGPHDGRIRVRNLCRGYTLQVRFVVQS